MKIDFRPKVAHVVQRTRVFKAVIDDSLNAAPTITYYFEDVETDLDNNFLRSLGNTNTHVVGMPNRNIKNNNTESPFGKIDVDIESEIPIINLKGVPTGETQQLKDMAYNLKVMMNSLLIWDMARQKVVDIPDDTVGDEPVDNNDDDYLDLDMSSVNDEI